MSLKKLVLFFAAVIAMSAGLAFGQVTGSGFFITTDGYFVTNQHVVDAAKKVAIRTVNGKTYPAEVVRVDTANDLAILKAEGTFRALPVQTSQNVRRGDKVFTLGFPNTDVQGVEPKYTEGVISSLTGIRDEPNSFQISVSLQPGNSGGPLISSLGNVVGIVAAKLSAVAMVKSGRSLPENVNYAVKTNYLLELISTLPSMRGGMSAVRTKPAESMSDLATLAEAAVGLVVVEIDKGQGVASRSPPPKTPPPEANPPNGVSGIPPLDIDPRNSANLLNWRLLPPSAIASMNIGPVSTAFPAMPIRIIVPTLPGGLSDLMARYLAQSIAKITGGHVVVDNRAGTNTIVGAELAARSAPNGYTLLLMPEQFVLNASIYKQLPFNPTQSFSPVTMLQTHPQFLMLSKSLSPNSVPELIAFLKSVPRTLQYRSGGHGSMAHFAGEIFSAATGVNLVHVQHQGLGPAIVTINGGNESLIFLSPGAAMPQIKVGQLKILAVTSSVRSSLMPSVPTLLEVGVTGVEIVGWSAIAAPANTPIEVVNKLNRIFVQALQQLESNVAFSQFGLDLTAGTPEDTRNFIYADLNRYRRIAQLRNIKAEN